MTTDRAVMQGALDALSEASLLMINGSVLDQHCVKAIAALRQALAQPVPDVAAVTQDRDEWRTRYEAREQEAHELSEQIIELEQCAQRLMSIGCSSGVAEGKLGGEWLAAVEEIRAAMGTQPAPTSGKLEPVGPDNSKMIAAPAVVAGLSVAVCPNCCDTGTEHGVYASYPCMFCKKLAATKGAKP